MPLVWGMVGPPLTGPYYLEQSRLAGAANDPAVLGERSVEQSEITMSDITQSWLQCFHPYIYDYFYFFPNYLPFYLAAFHHLY
jgi:hypothetical protein